MEENEDLFVVTGTIQDALSDITSDSAKLEILKDHFLTAAMVALFEVRKNAGLSQEQVAAAMGTAQPSVARWEHDFEGGMSLRRYVDFAIACGVIPADISLEPISSRQERYFHQFAETLGPEDSPIEFDDLRVRTNANAAIEYDGEVISAA